MRTFIAFPPLRKSTGGTAVLEAVARHLAQAGYEVILVPREAGAHPALDGLTLQAWDEAAPDPGDIWLSPEGWPALLLPGLRRKARTVLYVQNWAYLPRSTPGEIGLDRLPVHLLTVSQPVAWHAREFAGKTGPILRPGIDVTLFHPAGGDPDRPLALGETVRIAWMPRKNKALAQQIRDMIAARRERERLPAATWVPIHNLTREEVAATLRSCHIFVATGFPEGCPLPPLEAMASGCLVVGFGGFGGWDYMRQAWPGGYEPWWPQRPDAERPWGGNGLYVADADTVAASLALEYGLKLLARGGAELARIREAATATARAYSLEAQGARVRELWEQASAGIAFPPFLD